MARPHVSQVDLVCGIMKVLADLGVKEAEPRIVNACINAADNIYKVVNTEPVMATDNMGLTAWLKSDDTGLSSLFMAQVLMSPEMRVRAPADPAFPLDAGDFGRCYRFLRAVPQARTQFQKMGELPQNDICGRVWAAYVAAWDRLEQLYEKESKRKDGKMPKLYAAMQKIREEAEHG